jgi:hypothetical protein
VVKLYVQIVYWSQSIVDAIIKMNAVEYEIKNLKLDSYKSLFNHRFFLEYTQISLK